jgi:hypothetical protein
MAPPETFEECPMRSYLPDSPQASARVLALILIADGGVADAELRAALAHPAAARLGLDPTLIDEVLRALCEDLQLVSRRRWGRELEPALLDPLLDRLRGGAGRRRAQRGRGSAAGSPGPALAARTLGDRGMKPQRALTWP